MTAAPRSTPGRCRAARTCRRSSGPAGTSGAPSATSRAWRVEVDDPALLPDAVREQARAGDGWVKLVGDWIDREVGDLAPVWPDDVLAAAIDVAHAEGARVTAHVFGTDALPGLIGAGIDCIEHGTGLTDDLIAEMARRGTALVPTLINVDNFPGIADSAHRFPAYAAHMRELHAGARDVVRRAAEAGVPVYAGTDAGGGIRHGRIADEIAALHAAGVPDALGAASWRGAGLAGPAGRSSSGAPADLIVYRDDPRADPAVLRAPRAGAAARAPVPPLIPVRPGSRADGGGPRCACNLSEPARTRRRTARTVQAGGHDEWTAVQQGDRSPGDERVGAREGVSGLTGRGPVA